MSDVHDLPPTAPDDPWELIPLGDQFDNHDEFRPELIDALVGRSLSLHPADGSEPVAVAFGETTVALAGSLVPGWYVPGSLPYEAFDIRAFEIIGVVIGDLPRRRSTLMLLDLAGGRALANASALVGADDAVREETRYLQFGVDRPLDRPFERSTALVGHRVHQRYSSTHAFEHIHLNPGLYAFHCMEGPEAGIGDVDKADYWAIADDLTLFSWHERQQPFNGAVVTDLVHGRTRGRLFGWDAASGQALQIRTGSISTLLNVTRYAGL